MRKKKKMYQMLMLEYNCKIQSKMRRKKKKKTNCSYDDFVSNCYIRKNDTGKVIFKDKKLWRKLLLNNRQTFRNKNT